MYVSSYLPFTLPYYFQTSNSLATFPKVNPNGINSGRGGIISKDSAQFFFSLGDVNVDNKNINFIDVPDTINYNNLDNLNSVLMTEPFTVTDNSNFSFSENYGTIDSSTALSILGNKGNITYKVELLDNLNNKVLGQLDKIKISASEIPLNKTVSYKVNTAGLGGKTIKIRIEMGYSLDNPTINLVEKYADVSLMGKSTSNEISIQSEEFIKTYSLDQNYPNPFNPTTTINYQIPNNNYVTLKVYDVLGNVVKTLVDDYKTQGKYSVNFDASNLASGVYFYQLKAGSFIATKKLLLLK